MFSQLVVTAILGAALGTFSADPVLAQADFPARNITMVVPFPAGGTADLLCRYAGEKASAELGQQVVIENRPGGAGGRVGIEQVLRATPDGYTLLCSTQLSYSITHLVFSKSSFDPRPLEPISVLATYPLVILTRANLPVNSLAEFNAYANGTYVGDAPLGPFTYAPYNPVAYKPGGFVQGAGHGNTFEDVHGNWWNTGTPWVAVNWNFERRIAMHPAGFDANGQMWSDTRFGDFPHWAPTKKWTTRDESFTGWMLLSYRKPARASSTRKPEVVSPTPQRFVPAWATDSTTARLSSFAAANVTDENPRTFWLAESKAPSEWITVDLGKAYDVKAVQINYADYESGVFGTDSAVYTRFRISASSDGAAWRTIADLSNETHDRPNAYIELPQPVRARYVRYEHGHIGAANLAISDIRVFGNGSGPVPATPNGFTARRGTDSRSAVLRWQPVRGAVGYNVRWGIARDKLYQTYQVFADGPPSLELRALNVGQDYWLAIESFDENGVSKLSAPVHTP